MGHRAALVALVLAGCGYAKPHLTGGDDVTGDDTPNRDGGTDGGIDAPPDAPPGPADFLSFGFARAPSISDLTRAVVAKHDAPDSFTAVLPFDTNATQLVATFTTAGGSVTVGGVDQTSGVTANSFALPVKYVVTSADGLTQHSYTITAHSPTFVAGPQFSGTTLANATAFLTLADVDRDGWLDLVFAATGGSVYRNKTSTGQALTFAGSVPLGTTAHGEVITGDFNGDGGNPDLVAVDAASVTYFGGSDGTSYSGTTAVPVGGGNTSLASADYDGDGKPDLAVMSMTGAKAYVLLNTTPATTGPATFAAGVPFATGTSPFTISTGDINGDGKPDILTVNGTDATVLINASTGPGSASFTALPSIATLGGSPAGVLADVNGDGKLDIVAADFGASIVTVLLNTTTVPATPTFGAAKTFATGGMPWTVVAYDVDGDGRPDLLTPNQGDAFGSASSMSVLINTTPVGSSTLSFKPHVDIPTPNVMTMECVVAGDLDGDGLPELVAGGINRAQVFVQQ